MESKGDQQRWKEWKASIGATLLVRHQNWQFKCTPKGEKMGCDLHWREKKQKAAERRPPHTLSLPVQWSVREQERRAWEEPGILDNDRRETLTRCKFRITALFFIPWKAVTSTWGVYVCVWKLSLRFNFAQTHCTMARWILMVHLFYHFSFWHIFRLWLKGFGVWLLNGGRKFSLSWQHVAITKREEKRGGGAK